jgi:ubiquinone/menaquinone biosynthesis C-methylase UbiE
LSLERSADSIKKNELINGTGRIKGFFMAIPIRIRAWLSRHFRGAFSRLYSTLDNQAEVPVQVAAYQLVTKNYVRHGDSVLDVGFGLGYGLEIMAEKAERLSGLEIDRRAVARLKNACINPKIVTLKHFDGYSLPFPERNFDVVTCIDVIEHVADYMRLLTNLCNVARRNVIISTPNRRPENTNPDGKPKNPWHIREWSYEEFDHVLKQLEKKVEWNFLNGPWDGPFAVSQGIENATLALTPAIILGDSMA